MRYAVFSDVHANADALGLMLADAAREGVRSLVCLGDVVGYGPQPAEAVRMLRESGAQVVAGNHDDAVSGRGSAEGFISLAADAVERHSEALSLEDLKWLASLPYTVALDGGAIAAHGDIADPPAFNYIGSRAAAAANFAATSAPLVFVGHTHLPCLFLVGHSGTVYETPPQDFTLEDGKRYIVNVGSVGYPRESNGSCRSSYVIYDSVGRTVEFRFLPFSVAGVMQRGGAARDARPGRARKAVLAAAFALALAVLAAAAAFLFGGDARGRVEQAGPPFAEAAVRFSPGQSRLRANLFLERNSAPVLLCIRFRDSEGQEIPGSLHCTVVKKSQTRSLPLPPGAAAAVLEVREEAAERGGSSPAPKIVRFDPKGE